MTEAERDLELAFSVCAWAAMMSRRHSGPLDAHDMMACYEAGLDGYRRMQDKYPDRKSLVISPGEVATRLISAFAEFVADPSNGWVWRDNRLVCTI